MTARWEVSMGDFSSKASEEFSKFCNFLSCLHADERGDNENLGRLLILALVLIPLIILIAIFGQDIVTRARAAWDSIIGKEVKPK
jgi:hypothetical protein